MAEVELLMEQVSGPKLMEYTEMIASEVRLSGSPEEKKIFEYIKACLDEHGIPNELTYCDGYISLPKEATLCIDEEYYPCITASMAAPTSKEGKTLELMMVGDENRLRSIGEQVAGKAIVLYGFTSRTAVQRAEQFGAAACIFINGEHLHSMICSPVWGNPTPSTYSLIPNIHVLSVDRYWGEKLVRAAEQHKKAHITAFVDCGWRKIPTLVAEIPGEEEPDKFILFSGHVDSWDYGAMDNGGANAAMIEIIKQLSTAHLRRSLKVAFWSGHSHGRYAGSAHYMDAHFKEIYENCLLHVNIDSVGAKGASVITEGNIMSLTRRLAVDVIGRYTGQTFKGRPMTRGGDHSFWGAGIPSAFMSFSGQPFAHDPDDKDTQYMITQFNNGPESCGFGWWWHSAEDTIDKIDASVLRRDTQLYLAYLYHCLNDTFFPLDLNAGVQEVFEYLDRYEKKAEKYISLSPVKEAMTEVDRIVAELERIKAACKSQDEIKKHNEMTRMVGQLLVHLLYSGNCFFQHDPALPQKPILLLSIAEQFTGQDNQDEDFMLTVELRRRINQCVFWIEQCAKQVWPILHSLAVE